MSTARLTLSDLYRAREYAIFKVQREPKGGRRRREREGEARYLTTEALIKELKPRRKRR